MDHGVEAGRHTEELPDPAEHGVHELNGDAHLDAAARGGCGRRFGFDAVVGGSLATVEFAEDEEVWIGETRGDFGAQLILVGLIKEEDRQALHPFDGGFFGEDRLQGQGRLGGEIQEGRLRGGQLNEHLEEVRVFVLMHLRQPFDEGGWDACEKFDVQLAGLQKAERHRLGAVGALQAVAHPFGDHAAEGGGRGAFGVQIAQERFGSEAGEIGFFLRIQVGRLQLREQNTEGVGGHQDAQVVEAVLCFVF